MNWLQNLTQRNEIGANCYLVEWEGTRFLLDAGMHPKEVGRAALPDLHLIPSGSLQNVFLTHSHHDHSGGIPIVQEEHPEADIYVTEPAAALTEAILHNSVTVMTSQREEEGIMEYPLFTHRHIDMCTSRWRTVPYRKPIVVGDSEIRAEFFDAGHILGSAGILFRKGDKTLFYTGDVHVDDQTIIKGAEFPEGPIDVLVMETTRGSKNRPEVYSRAAEEEHLARVITETIKRGGAVLLPVFAMGKTQELLAMLHLLKKRGAIPDAPIMMGGLGTKMTIIYDQYAHEGRRLMPGFQILREMQVESPPRAKKGKRKPIQCIPGHIYALSSGMMTENTTSNLFAREFLPNEKNTLCFVGYTDPDSPGYTVRHSAKGEAIRLDRHRGLVPRNCAMEEFDFSGHAPRTQLLEMAIKMKPKQIFLVHGDPEALAWFKKELSEALPDAKIIIPPSGEKVPLDL